jgi:hypothetical protein
VVSEGIGENTYCMLAQSQFQNGQCISDVDKKEVWAVIWFMI